MPISVRLDSEMEALVNRTARALGKKKSDVIRNAIQAHCAQIMQSSGRTLYDTIKDLIGQVQGPADLSTNVRKQMLEILHAKQERARRYRTARGTLQPRRSPPPKMR